MHAFRFLLAVRGTPFSWVCKFRFSQVERCRVYSVYLDLPAIHVNLNARVSLCSRNTFLGQITTLQLQ